MHSPEDILELLRSISSLKLDTDGELLVQYYDTGDEYHVPMGYKPDSFTRQFLELIEAHLNGEKVFLCQEEDEGKDVGMSLRISSNVGCATWKLS